MDAVELLIGQHEEIKGLFSSYEELGEGETERRDEIAKAVVRRLVQHAEIEEQIFYPTVREAMPRLDEDIAEDLEEHQQAEELLARIDRMDPDDPELDPTFRELMSLIRHHIEEEENDLLPQVRDRFDQQILADLGESMEALQENAPTRPHPRSPNEPPANVLAGPGAAALDRARDAIREMRAD